jgi:hypothetical protein
MLIMLASYGACDISYAVMLAIYTRYDSCQAILAKLAGCLYCLWRLNCYGSYAMMFLLSS